VPAAPSGWAAVRWGDAERVTVTYGRSVYERERMAGRAGVVDRW
jgi:hypothetical protein